MSYTGPERRKPPEWWATVPRRWELLVAYFGIVTAMAVALAIAQTRVPRSVTDRIERNAGRIAVNTKQIARAERNLRRSTVAFCEATNQARQQFRIRGIIEKEVLAYAAQRAAQAGDRDGASYYARQAARVHILPIPSCEFP